MAKTDILVIGGGAAGMVATIIYAQTVRLKYREFIFG